MTDKPTVVEALAAVMEDVRAVSKDDRNTDQNYSFRGVDAVMNAVGPMLRRHNVVVMPICEEAKYRDVTTSRGKPSRECTVKVRYRFYGPAGDYIEAVTPGESMDFGDKGAPKAMSVAYRIVLLQALCLPTHEPEPDAATYERAVTPEPTPAELVSHARGLLSAACHDNRWDLGKVAALWQKTAGHPLSEAVDAARIGKFREHLFALPEEQLRADAPTPDATTPAPTSNGGEPTTVAELRAELPDRCRRQGYDERTVADLYAAETGTYLRDEADVDRLRGFMNGLDARPTKDLTPPVPATNGAAQ